MRVDYSSAVLILVPTIVHTLIIDTAILDLPCTHYHHTPCHMFSTQAALIDEVLRLKIHMQRQRCYGPTQPCIFIPTFKCA